MATFYKSKEKHSKIYVETQMTEQSKKKKILRKKRIKLENITLPDFSLYYEVRVIKTYSTSIKNRLASGKN